MYDNNQPAQELGRRQECKPNYEEMAARLKKKIDVFLRFKGSLVEFIQTIGRHSLTREPSSMYELLGKVKMDCLEQEREYNNLLSKLEDGS